MNNRNLPALLGSIREPDQANRTPTRYRLWLGRNSVDWNNANNWSGTGIPSGTSNVLFAGNSKLYPNCTINTDISVNTLFSRRDFNNGYLSFGSDKTLIAQKQYRFDTRTAGTSFNTNTIILCSGHFIVDSTAFFALGQSKLRLSGNLRITDCSPTENLSTVTFANSGSHIYSVIPLNKINILNSTNISGSLVTRGRMQLSGVLNLGGNLIFDGSSAKLRVATGGRTYGDGAIIIQNEGQIESQSGYLDNSTLSFQNNNIGNVIAPGIYSCRNIQFYNSDLNQDSIVFVNGNYRFESNVQFISSGGGNLEINNLYGNANVEFDKNIDVIKDLNTNSRVNWIPGTGIVSLGKARSIGKQFQGFRDGRGATNVIDSPRGMVRSTKNKLDEKPLIWMLNATGLAPVQINVITSDAHTVGGVYLGDVTGVQLGDICRSKSPANGTERLFVGDIADTGNNRPYILIYQFTEPVISGYNFSFDATDRTYSGVYETGNLIPSGEFGGRARDCRAMFNHYFNDDCYFITHKTNPAQLFQMTGAHVHGSLETLFYRGNLRITGVVGADLTRDGTQLLVKTWNKVYHYTIGGTGATDIWYALTGTDPVEILDYNPDYMEQGITWGSGDNSFYTVATFNSGLHDPLLRSPFYTYDKRSTINLSGTHLDNLEIDVSGHTKHFTSSGRVESFSFDMGLINFGNQNLTSYGDFYVGPAANFNRRGFNNSIINVSGDLLLVGTNANDLNMFPDSGDGSWQLNVMGNARAYYVNARVSDASRGSTIYAYNSSNYGGNTNWNFGTGGAPTSGSMLLVLQGYSNPQVTGGIDLRLYGYTGDSSGTLTLFLSGAPSATHNTELYLYLTGTTNDVTANISLFLGNSGIQDSVPIYIYGLDRITGNPVYLYLENWGMESGLNLYINGYNPTSGNMDLIVWSNAPETSGIDLYINSMNQETKTLKLYSHGRHAL